VLDAQGSEERIFRHVELPLRIQNLRQRGRQEKHLFSIKDIGSHDGRARGCLWIRNI
jgi:hypothetical protein